MDYGIKNSVDINLLVDFLNDLLMIDPDAIKKLVSTRVLCNSNLANHPSVQVQVPKGTNQPMVGFIGVLNGLFGIDAEGWGQLAFELDDNTGDIIKFYKTSILERGYTDASN